MRKGLGISATEARSITRSSRIRKKKEILPELEKAMEHVKEKIILAASKGEEFVFINKNDITESCWFYVKEDLEREGFFTHSLPESDYHKIKWEDLGCL